MGARIEAADGEIESQRQDDQRQVDEGQNGRDISLNRFLFLKMMSCSK